MVEHHHEDVIRRACGDQGRAEQRTGPQIERRGHQSLGRSPGSGVAIGCRVQVDSFDGHSVGRIDDLAGPASPAVKWVRSVS